MAYTTFQVAPQTQYALYCDDVEWSPAITGCLQTLLAVGLFSLDVVGAATHTGEGMLAMQNANTHQWRLVSFASVAQDATLTLP